MRAALGALMVAILAFAASAAAQEATSDPDSAARARFEEGLAAVDRGDDVTAERAFRASLEVRWSVSAAYNLAQILARHGDYGEATELLQRMIDDEETPAELVEQARGQLTEIRQAAQRAEDAERRGLAQAAIDRAEAASASGDLVGARDAYTEAFELTGNPELRFSLGHVEAQMGNREAAAEHYRAFVSAAPAGPQRQEAQAWLAASDAPMEAEASGPDLLAFGLILGLGSAATVGLAVLAAIWWDEAQADYERALRGSPMSCAPSCPTGVRDDIQAQLTETNVYLGLTIGVGVLTAAGATLALVLAGGGESDDVALQVRPGGLSISGQF